MIARVLLPLPLDVTFDFLVPEELVGAIAVGKRVRVRFRDGERWGIVLGLAQESAHEGPLEEVVEVSSGPAFSLEALSFASFVAEHYLAPRGPVLNRILPARAAAREDRLFTAAENLGETVEHLERLSRRAPRQAAVLRLLLATPGPYSEGALRAALGSVRAPLERLLAAGLVREVAAPDRRPLPVRPADQGVAALLPEVAQALFFAEDRFDVYAGLVERTLARGSSALVLAPEILLARELHAHLTKRLSEGVALYHSARSEGERGDVWERARQGKARVVVGTRSALFLPLPSLELLVLDEEQDRSYKQDEMLPYYQARWAARERGKEGLVLYGSNAPSLESFHAAREGDLALLRPPQVAPRPKVHLVDLKGERIPLSEHLVAAIEETLAAGREVLLGVNRLGYFRAVLCRDCGRSLGCPRCGVNLAYRPATGQLVCRVCGRAYPRHSCPECGSKSLRFVGMGSERVEAEVRERFPGARVARIDVEVLRTAREERAGARLLAEEVDILVATPMIAKGPPLPRVGLVAAVGVDALLALPDFRAAEWTYQYLVGLTGRLLEGEAIVETHYPEHYAIQAAASGDYDGFYARESAERAELSYPPFVHLARLLLPARSDPGGKRLSTIVSSFDVELLGPSPSVGRRGFSSFLVKGKDEDVLRAACTAVRGGLPRAEVDLDPSWF